MGSRLTFLHRQGWGGSERGRRRVAQHGGWFRVQARRLGRQDPIGTNDGSRPRRDEVGSSSRTLGEPILPRKAARRAPLAIVLETDSGGRGEYPKARERTLVKELGKFTP